MIAGRHITLEGQWLLNKQDRVCWQVLLRDEGIPCARCHILWIRFGRSGQNHRIIVMLQEHSAAAQGPSDWIPPEVDGSNIEAAGFMAVCHFFPGANLHAAFRDSS